ncbi:hypothetical protein [Streptomyces flaveolus]|uniref:hypothetical protein n=1 Tax=Streptomyces flaveolus TaxID=67297 RepID=UPI0033E5E504
MSNSVALAGIGVTVTLAVCGWLVLIWLENHKTTKEELNNTAKTVGKVDMEMRTLDDLEHPATGAEVHALTELVKEVGRAGDQHNGELAAGLHTLAGLLRQYGRVAAPVLADVRDAHLAAVHIEDVPADLTLERVTAHAHEQELLRPQIHAAVRAVEGHIRRQRRLQFIRPRP